MNLMTLFSASRTAEVALDGRDIAILETLKRASTALCATEVHLGICEANARDIPAAMIFRRFREMERRGLIAPVRTLPARAPGGRGRPRVLYEMTEIGRRALRLGEVMVDPDRMLAAAS